jgi:hypothetical protein
MYFIEPKKKERKKLYVYEEKRRVEAQKISLSIFPSFLRYGKKIPSALGESCRNRKFSFNLILYNLSVRL